MYRQCAAPRSHRRLHDAAEANSCSEQLHLACVSATSAEASLHVLLCHNSVPPRLCLPTFSCSSRAAGAPTSQMTSLTPVYCFASTSTCYLYQVNQVRPLIIASLADLAIACALCNWASISVGLHWTGTHAAVIPSGEAAISCSSAFFFWQYT